MKKNKSDKRIIIVILFIIAFYFTDRIIEKEHFIPNGENKSFYLPVIETTDIHGYMVDISSGDEATYEYRLSYIANDINKLRADGDILLLDTGDFYQGNVLSNKLDGDQIKAYIDELKYDAVCLGNHEFDWNLDAVLDHDGTVGSYYINDNIKGDSDVPVVCYNLYDKGSGKKVDYTKDYVIVNKKAKSSDGEVKDINIAIFGYINDYSSSINKSKIKDYVINEDDIYDIEKKAEELENNGKADITIIVSHASPDELSDIFNCESVIDLAICGHSHKTGTGELNNKVPYIIAGKYAQSYAEAILEINNSGVSVSDMQVVSVTQDRKRLYDTKENEKYLDEKILDISHAAVDEVNSYYPEVMEQLGYITTSIVDEKIDNSIGEDVLTNWGAYIIAKTAGADLGVVNSTGIRSSILVDKNETNHYVTGADIYSMFPFDDYIDVYEFTYEDVKELCCETKLNSHSYLGIYGVDAIYDSDDGNTVSTIYVGGNKIYDNGFIGDKSNIVTVAVLDYVADFDNLIFKQLNPISKDKSIKCSDAIIDYLKKNYGFSKEIPVDAEGHLQVLK